MDTTKSTRAKRRSPVRKAKRASPLSAGLNEAFSNLMRRFMVMLAALDLAKQSFGDLSTMSEEHSKAGLVVGEAVKELDVLYNELDQWHVSHEHAAKVRS